MGRMINKTEKQMLEEQYQEKAENEKNITHKTTKIKQENTTSSFRANLNIEDIRASNRDHRRSPRNNSERNRREKQKLAKPNIYNCKEYKKGRIVKTYHSATAKYNSWRFEPASSATAPAASSSSPPTITDSSVPEPSTTITTESGATTTAATAAASVVNECLKIAQIDYDTSDGLINVSIVGVDGLDVVPSGMEDAENAQVQHDEQIQLLCDHHTEWLNNSPNDPSITTSVQSSSDGAVLEPDSSTNGVVTPCTVELSSSAVHSPLVSVVWSNTTVVPSTNNHCSSATSSTSSISSAGSNTDFGTLSPSDSTFADDTLTSLAWLQNLNVCMTKLGAPTPPTPPASPICFHIASTPGAVNRSSTLSSSSNTKQSKRGQTAKTRKGGKSSILCVEHPNQFITTDEGNTEDVYENYNNNNTSTTALNFTKNPITKMDSFQELRPAVVVPSEQLHHGDSQAQHSHHIHDTGVPLQNHHLIQCQTYKKLPSHAVNIATTTTIVESPSPSSPHSPSSKIRKNIQRLKATDKSRPSRPSSDNCLNNNEIIISSEADSESRDVDYQLDGSVKPPFSYATLITMALQSTQGKMTLDSIYKWIRENFLYYRLADSSWQNSIRHNLSLNKCFIKIARTKEEPGKGGFWKLDPNCDVGSFKKRKLQGKSKSVEGELQTSENCTKRKRIRRKNNSELDESFTGQSTGSVFTNQPNITQSELLNAVGSINSTAEEASSQLNRNVYYNYSTNPTNSSFELTGYGPHPVNIVGQNGNIEAVIETGNDICWNAILTESDLNQLEVDPMSYTDSVTQIIHPIDSSGNPGAANTNGTSLPTSISVDSDLYYGDPGMQNNTQMVHIINETAQWNEWINSSTVDVISPGGGTVSYLVESSSPPLTRQNNANLAGDIYIPVTHSSDTSSIIIKCPPNVDGSHFESINSTSSHPWADCKDAIEVAALELDTFNSIEQMPHF